MLLHGFAATSFTWRKVANGLSGDHQVIALDREWVPLRSALESTITELSALDIEAPVLVGHSAGAELAVLLAGSTALGVRALVLEAPVIGIGPPALVRGFARLPLTGTVAAPLLRFGARAFMRQALRPAWGDRSTLTAEVVDGFRDPLLRPGVTEAMWKMTADPSRVTPDWDVIAAIDCLVIKGDRDRWTTSVHHPKATVKTYAGCGHVPHEEQPDRFVADVAEFLDSLD